MWDLVWDLLLDRVRHRSLRGGHGDLLQMRGQSMRGEH